MIFEILRQCPPLVWGVVMTLLVALLLHSFRYKFCWRLWISSSLGLSTILIAASSDKLPTETIYLPDRGGTVVHLQDRAPRQDRSFLNRQEDLNTSLLRRGSPAGVQVQQVIFGDPDPDKPSVADTIKGILEATNLIPRPRSQRSPLPRILLTSDGLWTPPPSSIPDSILTAPNLIGAPTPRTQLLALNAPRHVDPSSRVRIEVDIQIGTPDRGRLLLSSNRQGPLAESPLESRSIGFHRFKWGPIRLDPGQHLLTVQVESNTSGPQFLRKTIHVDPPLPVLLIRGSLSQDNTLERALSRSFIQLTTFKTPHKILDRATLSPYRLVILEEVNPEDLSLSSLSHLDQAVRERGIGLIFIASQVSPQLHQWNRSPIGHSLPVSFSPVSDQKSSTPPPSPPSPSQPSVPAQPSDKPETTEDVEVPRAALILAIDKSGSMAGTKMGLAKESAIATSRLLSSRDWIGVVAFDAKAHWVIRPIHVTHPRSIEKQIARLSSGGDTDMLPALQEARKALIHLPAHLKHIILLTDGFTALRPMQTFIQDMARKDRITLSTIGIGEEFDHNLLSRLSLWGHGSFNFTLKFDRIPQLVIRDARRVLRRLDSRQTPLPSPPTPEQTVRPQPTPQRAPPSPASSPSEKDPAPSPVSADRWKVTVDTPAPPLRGIDALADLSSVHPSTLNPLATVYLEASPKNSTASSPDRLPLLSGLRAGVGRVLVLNSKARELAVPHETKSDPFFPRLWSRLCRWIAASNLPPYRLSIRYLDSPTHSTHLDLQISPLSSSLPPESSLEIVPVNPETTPPFILVPLAPNRYRLEIQEIDPSRITHFEARLVSKKTLWAFPPLLIPRPTPNLSSPARERRSSFLHLESAGGDATSAPEKLTLFPQRTKKQVVPWNASLYALPTALFILTLLARWLLSTR
ncbi:MAG: vWA domain-containing protein [Planctomycetota bacterium]|nr:vWA domain-containing protein [Planctomycetota bacterium]